MYEKSILQQSSFDFAVQIFRLSRYLYEKKEFILAKQIMRSGTSVGANIQEAQSSSSNADFIHKLSISLREARETEYWLRILKSVDCLSSKFNPLLLQIDKIIRILVTSINTMKNRL